MTFQCCWEHSEHFDVSSPTRRLAVPATYYGQAHEHFTNQLGTSKHPEEFWLLGTKGQQTRALWTQPIHSACFPGCLIYSIVGDSVGLDFLFQALSAGAACQRCHLSRALHALSAAALETPAWGWESVRKGKKPNNKTPWKKAREKLAFLPGGEESLANLRLSVPRSQTLIQSPVKNEFFPNEILKED